MNKVFCCESNKHGEYLRRGNARIFTANARSFRANEGGNSNATGFDDELSRVREHNGFEGTLMQDDGIEQTLFKEGIRKEF